MLSENDKIFQLTIRTSKIFKLYLLIVDPIFRLNPQISFPWSEIKHLTFKDTKFMIKPVDKKAPKFTFFTTSGKSSKQILNLGVGNHQLYVKRRKPESPEVARMREKANAVRDLRRDHK